MKLLQYRQGFATNSSSSHSIIIANKLTKVVLTGTPLNKGDNYSPGEFGWEHFTLSSKEAKMEYLATLIKHNLDLPDWMADKVANSTTGASVDKDAYIDHQSILTLPRDWSGTGLDEQFLYELKEFLSQDDVMILGGNDNSDDRHPLTGCGPRVLTKIPKDRGGNWVCRKNNNEWTLFNRYNGDKITFTFDDSVVERKRPNAPELIDIKLTNFCPFLCSWCYQNSTLQGKHADKDNVQNLARDCKEHRVFECAFGGGEPTLYPDFVDILSYFRYHGVVPNFTTRNLAWLRDEKLRPEILEYCGSFALSVNKADEVKELGELVRRHCVSDKKIVIHYVLGSSDKYYLGQILREAKHQDFSITLLGWKTTGRGAGGPLHNNADWLETALSLRKDHCCPTIGVDTVIANEYEEQIKQAGIPDYLLYTEEGKFSMYYDAVEDKYGPSSFCEDNEYVQIGEDEGLIDAWNKIKPTKRGKKKEKT